MRVLWRRRLVVLMAASAVIMALTPQMAEVAGLPRVMTMRAGSTEEIPASAMLEASVEDDGNASARISVHDGALELSATGEGSARLTYSLLGLLPVQTVDVRVSEGRRLVPGGESVGVAIDTKGVIVVGASDLGSVPSPARLAGIRNGDIIQRVNGVEVESADALSASIDSGETVNLDILRKGEAHTCEVTPAVDMRDGSWRLGAWVRDSTAGVGTLTFSDPETGLYGALGHAITDADTSVTMPVRLGELYLNRVIDVTPSTSGHPGELTGDFVFNATPIGTVALNSARGIFGSTEVALDSALYPDGLPVAHRREIHAGAASLLTTVDDSGVGEYDCEIVRVNDDGLGERAMVVRVTDPELIRKTGGIVQGMSGSPIIQDGRLVGAVTHVMVNDPEMGYGISIEEMLDEAAPLEEGTESLAA